MNYYLSIGSNLGDRLEYLQFAVTEISQFSTIEKASSIYETEAIGFETENLFLNACLLVKSILKPDDFLGEIHLIEQKAGRIRYNDGQYHSRPIDIDIILCDDLILITENLIIPHPKFTDRKFVLLPLKDLSENLIDPLSKKSIKTLLEDCLDNTKVEQQQLTLFI
ncbi:MAG: hypothetical protein RI922_1075 [Bacteroidota bacterium]|jgi:2-amino-4-hydroxy-6-hydroxymethyldihydropteridine diphosphokinase